MKRVLIAQGCFSCCWVALTQSQELFCLSLHPISEHAGGAQLGQPMPNGQRMLFFIPYHTVSCSACNTGERRSKRGHLEWRHLSSQVTSTCGGTLISWGWLNTCLSIRSDKWIPFFCFVCSCLQKQLLLYLLNSISTHKFSHLYPSDPLPILAEGSEWEVEGLSCWLGLKNDGTLCMIVNVSLLWLSKCIHTVFF